MLQNINDWFERDIEIHNFLTISFNFLLDN